MMNQAMESGKRRAFGAGVLVVLLLGVFGRTVGFDFINYDDPAYVYENGMVTEGVTGESVKRAFTEVGETNLWHPATWMSHMVDVEVFGVEHAGGHHAVNVFWQVVATVGLFLLLGRLTGSVWLALFLAAVWAVHPQRVQSVAWVSERKDVLSGAFFFFSWWGWERWRDGGRRGWYFFSLGLFVLAGLSKPSVVPLPLVLWVGEMLRGRVSAKAAAMWGVKLLPFAAVSLVVAGLTVYFQRTGGLADVTESMPWTRRAMLMPVSLWWYVESFLWPFPGRLWVYPAAGVLADLVKPVAGLTVLAAVVLAMGRRDRLWWYGGAVFLLLWLPVSGLVPVGFYFVADRYSYLIQVGLLLVAAGILKAGAQALGEAGRRKAMVCGAVAVLGIGLVSAKRVGFWRDSEALFSHERQINPESLLAPIHLGAVKEKRGDLEAALALYTEAGLINPESGLALTNAARVLLKTGNKADAEAIFARAHEAAILQDAAPFIGHAQLLAERGEVEAAEALLLGGLDRFPESVGVMVNLGALAQRFQADPPAALGWYDRALKVEPGQADALQGKGAALLAMGRKEEGLAILRGLLERYPDREAVREFLKQAER